MAFIPEWWSQLSPRQQQVLEQLIQDGGWVQMPDDARSLWTLRTLERHGLVMVDRVKGPILARATKRARQMWRSKRGQRERVSAAHCAQAIRMAHEGHSYQQIADALGLSYAVAHKIATGRHPAAAEFLARTDGRAAPTRRIRRHPDAVRRRAIQLRRRGMKIEQIAADLGVTKQTVSTWLHRAGLVSFRQMTAREIRECLRRRRAGASVEELCARFGRCQATIYNVLRLEKHGLAERILSEG